MKVSQVGAKPIKFQARIEDISQYAFTMLRMKHSRLMHMNMSINLWIHKPLTSDSWISNFNFAITTTVSTEAHRSAYLIELIFTILVCNLKFKNTGYRNHYKKPLSRSKSAILVAGSRGSSMRLVCQNLSAGSGSSLYASRAFLMKASTVSNA